MLNGSFRERKDAWDSLYGCLGSFDKSVYIIGLGAQGTVLLYCLLRMMAPWKMRGVTVIDANAARRQAFDDVIGLFG